MIAVTDLAANEFESLAESAGEKRFSGRNLMRWVYQRRARSFAEMSDLSEPFRDHLEHHATLRQCKVLSRREDGTNTTAFLLGLQDGESIETVLIPEGDRATVCVSTQVGCPVACVFCASGLNGLVRNLSAGEIIEQVLTVQDFLADEDRADGKSGRVTNVVVMGIGEPTLNLDALIRALTMWNDPKGLGLGARRITISTVGYPQRIDRLAQLGKEYGLAISLHAPTQELRQQLVPGAGNVAIPDLLAAAERYFDATSRRVTFEYVLLDGINAEPEHARQLVRLLGGRSCFVNLIPVNAVKGLPYQSPPPRHVQRFRSILEGHGIQVTQRKTRGDGIAAACGQLRLQSR